MRSLLFCLLMFFVVSPSFGNTKKSETEPTEKLMSQEKLSSTLLAANVGHKKGLGVFDSSSISTGQSLSAIFSSHENWIQTFLGFHRTDGILEFGLGGAYKFTLSGTRATGFHFGPGFCVGTGAYGTSGDEEFRFSVFGLLGGHFTLFERLMVSVDGGPNLTFIKGDGTFTFKPSGNLLGLGVHYLF